ncbi:MAG: hypothetical protein IPG92_18490 [Flavobacteriales bacterium]|nr:hypothetical protein [Flavobacteriales bacterium]
MGGTSVDVSVTLQQDNIPELDITVSINAGAAGHTATSASSTLGDDDVPGLELTLQTDTISEAGGFVATQATLRRTVGSNPIAFTASLSVNLTNTLFLPSGVSLAAGETQKTFDIGVVDNSLVDGFRNVTITAALQLASCGCSAPPASAGFVTAVLTVADNDGPALSVSTIPTTLAEGLPSAGMLRVQRNTPGDVALEVSLSSSNTNEATLPATAFIPMGASFVDVPITTVNDGVPDGSQQVYLNAAAAGFSPGIGWVLVTDINKPDLR